ncbi:hypothetical protein GGI35DRAFT_221580 [Trichoderma velutinum]
MLADTCRCLLVLLCYDQGRPLPFSSRLGSLDEVNEQKRAHSHRLTTVQKQAPDHFIEFSPSPSRLIR